MARQTIAARRYAEAAFQIAAGEDALDRWADDLATAADAVGSTEAAPVVGNPAVPLQARRAIIEKLLAGRVGRPVVNLVLLLAQRGRVEALPAVAAEYRRLLDLERGTVQALVTSAAPLEAAHLEALRQKVAGMTGARVDLTTAIDPSLIGGLTVRVGDTLIDASIRGRLERLRHQLSEGAR